MLGEARAPRESATLECSDVPADDRPDRAAGRLLETGDAGRELIQSLRRYPQTGGADSCSDSIRRLARVSARDLIDQSQVLRRRTLTEPVLERGTPLVITHR